MVLCHYVPCNLLEYVHGLSELHTVPFVGSVPLCLSFHLQSLHCISEPHTVPSIGFVSLCPLLSSKACPLPVNTSQCTVCQRSVSTLESNFCYWCVKISTVFSKVSPLPDISSHCTVCPMSVSTSHLTIYWFCVSMSSAVFDILSTDFQYPTLHRLLVLCHSVHY